ncbi:MULTISPECIES: type I-C CRISPR-associated protein Cas8c/Csd1 [Paenibacillus]|uniref:CRISPR-associated Csd1 family protein n=1 Tax=Paenibacillus pabuli TaxID=1472 RepID=A0A855Y0S8_9BACL|nr:MULTISPECIES: type I-C CRISPR-associated protein Cas8c/Csd1 [Paenibacillus]PWW44985.1 CRISPR-associated Csd1 family protein [Paenibacillus pabuli]PXW11321.1 CRISPR-associated Csd1 family protein [Paenibacillus taichungensis]
MNWLANLSKTYDDHADVVGQFEMKKNGKEYALIPISHTTQTAHIEVHLNAKGNIVNAYVVDKNDGSTIIPCTEASASRTSAPVPYPLFDKLAYVAGDYTQFCGEVKGTPYQDYLIQLKAWCESPFSHPKVLSVLHYVSKGTLITDLVDRGILHADRQGKLLEKWIAGAGDQEGEKPKIFNVIASDQSGAFVRFAVDIPGEPESRLWRDASVQQSFIQFYEMSLQDKDICFVTGDYLPVADKHASRIRHSGDKSKLISANDSSGFTYRGRFRTSRDAAVVSYEASQKGHNALKWLIDRQGTTIDGKVFLVWGSTSLDMPEPQEDTFSLWDEDDEEAFPSGDTTHKEFALQIRKAIGGYRYDGEYNSKHEVTILTLDAATPGRMSIMYYRNLDQDMYLDRLQAWHESCYWIHRYRKNKNDKHVSFIGAPATKDIAFAAYGPRASDKVVKGLMERMLPCIIDERPIPLDIVRSSIQRASNPVGMENWEWEKTLSITCALVNKKEGYGVSLNTEATDRSYLFGRMLAIADVLERNALGKEEKRATNAIRYMNAFAQRPGRTWSIIQSNLQPYQARMGTGARYYNSLLDEVGAKLQLEDFTDKPLTGLYLLGFYSQRNDLYTSKKDKEAAATLDDDENQMNEQGDN